MCFFQMFRMEFPLIASLTEFETLVQHRFTDPLCGRYHLEMQKLTGGLLVKWPMLQV